MDFGSNVEVVLNHVVTYSGCQWGSQVNPLAKGNSSFGENMGRGLGRLPIRKDGIGDSIDFLL